MGKGKAQDLFRSKAPWIMALLMRDFKIALDDSAAILGNLGHESGGFASLQETHPTVPGSRGGFGWAQWTGQPRRSFEAYTKRNGLDPASDKANDGWLFSAERVVSHQDIGQPLADRQRPAGHRAQRCRIMPCSPAQSEWTSTPWMISLSAPTSAGRTAIAPAWRPGSDIAL